VHRPSYSIPRFGRTFAALVLVTLTIALVLVVASLPWRELSSSGGGTERYYLGSWCFAREDYPAGTCVDYADRGAPLRDVFPQTYGLVLTALTLSVFELAFLLIALFSNTGRPGIRPGILGAGILGSVALLLAPVRLYFGLAGSMYSGSTTHNGVTYTWAESTGWFMAPYVAFFFLVATVVAFSAARQIKPIGSLRVSVS